MVTVERLGKLIKFSNDCLRAGSVLQLGSLIRVGFSFSISQFPRLSSVFSV